MKTISAVALFILLSAVSFAFPSAERKNPSRSQESTEPKTEEATGSVAEVADEVSYLQWLQHQRVVVPAPAGNHGPGSSRKPGPLGLLTQHQRPLDNLSAVIKLMNYCLSKMYPFHKRTMKAPRFYVNMASDLYEDLRRLQVDPVKWIKANYRYWKLLTIQQTCPANFPRWCDDFSTRTQQAMEE